MADADERRRRLGGARPLVGYRDVGEDVRHSRGSLVRAWIILLCLALFYLGWTLTVYFLEPGLR
jgi:hypothetical protein